MQNPLSFAENSIMTGNKRLLPVLLCVFLVSGIAACRNTADAPARDRRSDPPAVSLLDSAATAGMQQLLYRYYELEEALATTHSTATGRTAAAMQRQIGILRMQLHTTDTIQNALLGYLGIMSGNLSQLLSVKDESCERQRVFFKPVSGALYDALRLIRIQNLTIYHAFCPMAFREKGAYWLSEFPEIRNPYFGSKMIECGEVIDTLR